MFIRGIPDFKQWLDAPSVLEIPFTGLHNLAEKVPSVLQLRRAKSISTCLRSPGDR